MMANDDANVGLPDLHALSALTTKLCQERVSLETGTHSSNTPYRKRISGQKHGT